MSSHTEVSHLSIKLVQGLTQLAWAPVAARHWTLFEGLSDALQQVTDDGVAVPGRPSGAL